MAQKLLASYAQANQDLTKNYFTDWLGWGLSFGDSLPYLVP